LNNKGIGLKLHCGGQAELAILWKATPTYARHNGNVITVNYTCHEQHYHGEHVAASVEVEENVSAEAEEKVNVQAKEVANIEA